MTDLGNISERANPGPKNPGPKNPRRFVFLRHILKTFAKKRWVRLTLARLASLYIHVVYLTSRWRWVGEEYPGLYWKENKPVIVCFWHGRLLMMTKAWKSSMPFAMLISAHRDGELIARTVGHLGIEWIPGSSSKQAASAVRSLRQALKSGKSIGVTPDGPRGPCYDVSIGLVRLALLARVDILPLAFSVRRHRFLSSWDRFLLAFPFTRGAIVWGEALRFEDYREREELFMADLQKRLMAVTQKADELCGFTTPS